MGSVREDVARRERQQFVREFEQQQRDSEDQEQYGRYAKDMQVSGTVPLSFEEWRKFIPEEFSKEEPAVRAALASANSNWKQLVEVTKERVASVPLDDDELRDLGFDLRFRPIWENEYTSHGIAVAFEKFRDVERRFVPSVHFRPVGDFLMRNRIMLSEPHIQLAFTILLNYVLITPVEPEVEQLRANLRVEPDPEIERQKRLRDYEEKPVVRFEGRDYTQKELDVMDSQTYQRVMRMNTPRVTDVLRPEPR